MKDENSVYNISDSALLKRAVSNARSNFQNKGKKHPRWVAISDNFGLGSTYSQQLCRRFGLNPDEEVKR